MINVKLIDRPLQEEYFKPATVMFSKFINPELGDEELSQTPFEIIWHTVDEQAYLYMQSMFHVFCRDLGIQIARSLGLARIYYEGSRIELTHEDIQTERTQFSYPPDEDEVDEYYEEEVEDEDDHY